MNVDAHIFEVDVRNFRTEVVEKSNSVPVVLEFYAEGAQQSVATAGLLRKLANEYQGKFLLARVDIRGNPQLVQQLGVRTLPAIKVLFQGKIAADFEGAVEEPRLRDLLDQLTMSPMERVREQLDGLLAEGRRQQAISLLRQVIAEEPGNQALGVELCDLLVQEGDLDEARRMLSALPADTPGMDKARNRLAFIDEAGALPSLETLEARVGADDDNLTARYQLAIKLVAANQVEEALETLLLLLKKNRSWEEEKARTTMIKVFDMLGKGNEMATGYRRRMFTFLH